MSNGDLFVNDKLRTASNMTWLVRPTLLKISDIKVHKATEI